MSKPLDLTGKVFGKLTALEPVGKRGSSREFYWRCSCACGGTVETRVSQLRSGRAKSCGCACRKPRLEDAKIRHPLYRTWAQMRARCFYPSSDDFHRYGGRGITMCDRWLGSFELFVADVGPKPTAAHSIDRIDNDGNYEPLNCRWATRSEQMRNTSVNRFVTWNGESLCLEDWAKRAGLDPSVLRSRIEHGWSIDDAITAPLHARKGPKK